LGVEKEITEAGNEEDKGLVIFDKQSGLTR